MKGLQVIFFVSLVWLLNCCAPSVGPAISVYQIEPLPLGSGAAQAYRGVKLSVGEFLDSRATRRVGEMSGEPLEAEGDVALSVKLAIEDQLRTAGADLSLFAGPVVSGEILDWRVKVTPGFPARMLEAQAEIRLELKGPNGVKQYAAEYSGSVEQKHPLADKAMVEKALGDAMAYAIQAALSDRRLIERL